MKGKVITIESGSDSSGKATQAKKLYHRLIAEGYNVRKIEYPNYESQSSALVKMYLNGEFGADPNSVDPYIASTFYAVDRFASYRKEWASFYEMGGIIIADRYTTSNMVHQACKIQNNEEREAFLNWLWEYEFKLYKLPVPDCVIFLDMPVAYSLELMKDRKNKFTGSTTKDIHESNTAYLTSSYYNALEVANKYQWAKISCTSENGLRSIDEIHEQIYNHVISILNQ
jgi:dTMP kinase